MNDFPKPVADSAPPTEAPFTPLTVCGRVMTADAKWYPKAEYQGQTVYFCTGFCLEAFRNDPNRFYIAHSRRKEHE